MPGSNDYSMDPVLWDSEEITLNSPPSSTNLQTSPLSVGTNWEEVKNKRWNSYLLNLALTLNKINVKKARKYFDQLWDNEASLREVTDIGDNAKKKLDDLIFNFRDDWSLLKEKVDTPIEETKPSINFSSVKEALLWLTDNGYNTHGVDDMYGANTDTAINTALQDKKLDSGIRNQLTALLELYKDKWVPLKKSTIVPNTTPTNTLETPVGLRTINYGLGRIFALDELPYSSTQYTSKYNFQGDDSYWSLWSMQSAFDKMFEEAVFGGKWTPTVKIRNHADYNSEWENFSKQYMENPKNYSFGVLFNNKWIKKTPLNKQVSLNKQGGNLNNMNKLGNISEDAKNMAFLKYVIQMTGAKTQLEIKSLGKDVMQQLYQLFMEGYNNGSIEITPDGNINVKGRKAALGAKLSYFNKLQGKCPEGEQLVTFKIGGRMCTACLKGNKVEKKQTTNLNTNQQPKKLDPEKTPVLPGGKYPSYWTADDRIKWERKYGLKDEGAAVSPPPRKNQLGAALQLLLNKNR